MEKIILTDVDGVLLDWDYSFDNWMKEKGYEKHNNKYYDVARKYKLSIDKSREVIKLFNESSEIGFLKPFKDSVSYVKKLSKKGYRFHCITSLGKNLYSQKLRKINLNKLFGDVFDKFIFLDISERKDKVLNKYNNKKYYWVEDNLQNALDGIDNGLVSILMTHEHSSDIKNDNLIIVDCWHDIYKKLN